MGRMGEASSGEGGKEVAEQPDEPLSEHDKALIEAGWKQFQRAGKDRPMSKTGRERAKSRAAELHSLINKKCDRKESAADLRRISELVDDLDTLARIRGIAVDIGLQLSESERLSPGLTMVPIHAEKLRALLRAIGGET
jgi:hypothetical protein